MEYLGSALEIFPVPPAESVNAFANYHGSFAIFTALSGDWAASNSHLTNIRRMIDEKEITQFSGSHFVQVHYYPLAICAEAAGDLDSAVEHLETIISTNPGLKDFLLLAAGIYLTRGMPGDIERAMILVDEATVETQGRAWQFENWSRELQVRIDGK